MATNLVTRSVDGMLVLRENTETPTDEEWNECLRLLGDLGPDFSKVRVLVLTDGGGPTPAQRRRLSEVSQGQKLRSAVVSESMKVRFIVSSVALFMPEISSFRTHEMAEAYAHLKMDRRERLVVERMLKEMTAEITRTETQRATKPM